MYTNSNCMHVVLQLDNRMTRKILTVTLHVILMTIYIDGVLYDVNKIK